MGDKIKVVIETLDGSVPNIRYSTDKSACIDLFAREDVVIPSMFNIHTMMDNQSVSENMTDEKREALRKEYLKYIIKLIPLNIKINHNVGEFSLLFGRSSTSIKHGLVQANGVGVIDEDYFNEVKLPVYNITPFDYTVKKGDKIAQLLFRDYAKYDVVFDKVTKDSSVHAGFGSTGK